jgi:hypothetical protein
MGLRPQTPVGSRTKGSRFIIAASGLRAEGLLETTLRP